MVLLLHAYTLPARGFPDKAHSESPADVCPAVEAMTAAAQA